MLGLKACATSPAIPSIIIHREFYAERELLVSRSLTDCSLLPPHGRGAHYKTVRRIHAPSHIQSILYNGPSRHSFLLFFHLFTFVCSFHLCPNVNQIKEDVPPLPPCDSWGRIQAVGLGGKLSCPPSCLRSPLGILTEL